ncbi:hypothetical protein CPB84DRAFT_1850008 [Gymnopilus junonius]|uniref:Uncharacterized protein n=1 Tax=Gymnopilus junonius TaxID=109634 RepID=A0A9P5TKE7_GYMJU|nr:hypothetical protein CPB84DRAFT_1850008 [Gymnopilus junonius]
MGDPTTHHPNITMRRPNTETSILFNEANNFSVHNMQFLTAGGDIVTNNSPNDQPYRKIANWLTPINFRAIQSDTYSKCTRGTGAWFLDSHEFKDWLFEEEGSCVNHWRVWGGKDISHIIITKHLQDHFQSETHVAIVCAFFHSNDSHLYLTQFLSVSDVLGLVLKVTGMGIVTHTHTHQYPYP